MKNVIKTFGLASFVVVISAVFTGDAAAQFEIVSYSIDGGGGESNGETSRLPERSVSQTLENLLVAIFQ